MKNRMIKKILSKQTAIFFLIFILIFCFGLFSCNFISSPDKEKTNIENNTSQTSKNSGQQDANQGKDNITEGSLPTGEDSTVQKQAAVRLFIKDTVPAFALAALSHEAKNLFNGVNITEEKEPVAEISTDSYDIVADIGS